MLNLIAEFASAVLVERNFRFKLKGSGSYVRLKEN